MSSASYLSASTTAADASHDTRALQATADAIRELFTIMDERERVAFDSQTDASDVIVVTPERLHGALRYVEAHARIEQTLTQIVHSQVLAPSAFLDAASAGCS